MLHRNSPLNHNTESLVVLYIDNIPCYLKFQKFHSVENIKNTTFFLKDKNSIVHFFEKFKLFPDFLRLKQNTIKCEIGSLWYKMYWFKKWSYQSLRCILLIQSENKRWKKMLLYYFKYSRCPKFMEKEKSYIRRKKIEHETIWLQDYQDSGLENVDISHKFVSLQCS